MALVAQTDSSAVTDHDLDAPVVCRMVRSMVQLATHQGHLQVSECRCPTPGQPSRAHPSRTCCTPQACGRTRSGRSASQPA
eukprot:5263485-Pleurochrysis_carterae.AAC.1